MKTHSLVLLAALCAPVLALEGEYTHQQLRLEKAADEENRLEGAKMFAFGSVGFGGRVSEEEHQFKAILALEPAQAKQKLEKLYSSGNPQAMSYALAGMRKLDRKRYTELLVSARASGLIVTTMRGCIMSQEKLRTVADDLDSGIYNVWLR